MHLHIVLIILGVIALGTTVGISHAQSDEDNAKLTGAVSEKRDPNVPRYDRPQALLQMVLRNADGELIAYLETKEIVSARSYYIHQYLDTLPKKKIIMKDGEQYELFQFQRNEPTVQQSKYSMAMFSLIAKVEGKNRPILTMNHEAYQVDPGDQMKVYWNILRKA